MTRSLSTPEFYGTNVPVDVEFVIPVYNEGESIVSATHMLSDYLHGYRDELGNESSRAHMAPFSWRILIANNASTDGTWNFARSLVDENPNDIAALHLDQKGRGRALKTAWTLSAARVVAYMDVDLSTGLEHIDDLVLPLLENRADIAIGSRLMKESQTTRSAKREFISRTYNTLLRLYSGARFSDAQCGFKAIQASTFRNLSGHIEDDEWFFDTELLLLAQHHGLRLHQVPVRWIEDTNSSVHIADTVIKDLQGMQRMKVSLDKTPRDRTDLLNINREPLLRGSLIPTRYLTKVF